MADHPTPERCRLVVIGGGITGLAAAWQGLCDGAEVTVLEGSATLGGKIQTVQREGLLIEQGPDSFVAYRPAGMALIDELGLSDQVIAARGVRQVHLHARGAMRPMPEGMGMVLPTRLWPFVTTRVLGWADKLRAGLDLLLPRQLPEHDVAIGWLIRRRLGGGLVRRFADPLVGGIYGASVDELSLDAVLPSLRENEREHRSLMVASLMAGRAARRRATAAAPRGASSPFRSLAGGMGQLVAELTERLRDGGVDVRTGATVARLAEEGVILDDGTHIPADAVILAGGVASSRELLTEVVPSAAAALDSIPLASTTIVTLAWPTSASDPPLSGHGWLEAQRAPISGATFSSRKWQGRADGDVELIRVFVPEKVGATADLPDDELIATVIDHVQPLLHVSGEPVLSTVTRWQHVMPKYVVGHLDVVARVESALADHPCWRVAGSALRGVGIPDCIADGRRQTQLALASAARPTVNPASPGGHH